MPGYDFRSPRLFIDAPLDTGTAVVLERAQAHYLSHVLRLRDGDRVLVFNGRDGEWSGTLEAAKRAAGLRIGAQTRPQTAAANLHYLFAPLKAARLDYMVQKAVEMGASRLEPILTRHGQVTRVNLERIRANAIEAAEQCGILALPQVAPPVALSRYLAERDPARLLVFCDEDAAAANPATALAQVLDRVPARRRLGGPGRAGRRLCRGRARSAPATAERGAAFARAAHSARRHGGGRGPCRGADGARRLAVRTLN